MIWGELVVCAVAAAFFAGLETGLVSANQFALFAKKEKGILYARAADFLLLKPERLLSTTLIGTNIAVVTATVLLSNVMREAGLVWGRWIASIGLAVVLLIFSEVVPKSFFRQNADTVAVRLAPALVAFYFVFYPVAIVLNALVKLVLALTGQLRASKQTLSSKQSLRTLVRLSSREAGIPLSDLRMIEDIFDFQETLAREVMIQIHRTLACPLTMSIGEIVERAAAWSVRYVPIYEQRLDNILGFIDVESLAAADDLTLDAVLQQPRFYPETKPIPDLFMEMNEHELRVVFLSNEYGRISGMITPLEIVGEIMGRRPGGYPHQQEIVTLGDGKFRIAGLADLEDVQHLTGTAVPKGPYDTIGGFLLARFGRIPETGESLSHGAATFVVTDRDELHIKQVELTVWSSS